MLRSMRLYRWAAILFLVPLLFSASILAYEGPRLKRLASTGSIDRADEAAWRETQTRRARKAAEDDLGPPRYPLRPEGKTVRVTRTVFREVEVAGGTARVPVQETVEEFRPATPAELSAWQTRRLDIDAQHSREMEALTRELLDERLERESRARLWFWIAVAVPLPALLIALRLFLVARRVRREEIELFEEEQAFLSTPTPR